MKYEREKWIRYITLAITLTLALMSLLLWLLVRGRGRLEAGFALPRITPVPTDTPTPAPARVVVTPALTPKVVQVIRNYPPGAVDVVADGRVLYTAENPDAAWEAVKRYLDESAHGGLGADERLIRAGFDQKLSLEEPSGQGELLSVDEAVNTLIADEGLLPVSRTVVRCVIERGERENIARTNDRLMAGSRIYRSMGVFPYTLSYYETMYRGQAAFSEIKTNEFAVGPGRMDYLVEDGGYSMEEASRTAGPEAVLIEGFAPQWPHGGTVTGSFGMTEAGMRYGVEISTGGSMRVAAPEEGVIVYCAQRGEMGLVIDILHDETGCISRIIGCREPVVELYQRVKKGDPVGVLPDPVGSLPVRFLYELLVDGLPVNPEKYLPRRG